MLQVTVYDDKQQPVTLTYESSQIFKRQNNDKTRML